MSAAARAPDILLLVPDRQTRALVRAELAERGYEIATFDSWPVPRTYFRRELKPRLAIVDLHELPAPDRVVAELPALVRPDCAIVIVGLGTLSPDVLRASGFHVLTRPVSIDEIAAAAARLLG